MSEGDLYGPESRYSGWFPSMGGDKGVLTGVVRQIKGVPHLAVHLESRVEDGLCVHGPQLLSIGAIGTYSAVFTPPDLPFRFRLACVGSGRIAVSLYVKKDPPRPQDKGNVPESQGPL